MPSPSTERIARSVPTLVESALNSGKITRQEHLQLTSALLSGHGLTEVDRTQIDRVLDRIQMGKIAIAD